MANSMIKQLSLLLLLISLGFTAGDAVNAQNQKHATDRDLILNGSGMRKRGFLRIYQVNLFLLNQETNAEKILMLDEPREIVMRINFNIHTLTPNILTTELQTGFRENNVPLTDELKSQFAFFATLLEDLNKSDTMSFSYLPGVGTKVSIKGKEKAIVPGKIFADAFLRIWLGPKPLGGKGLKKKLLGIN